MDDNTQPSPVPVAPAKDGVTADATVRSVEKRVDASGLTASLSNEKGPMAVTVADTPESAEVDAFIKNLEAELESQGGLSRGFFDPNFSDPKHYTWLIVMVASTGGLLSGLDQSLISGANLILPKDLRLSTRQTSLVNSAMALGAICGALMLGPTNERFGRRKAIIISTIFYSLGAVLEAASVNFGMIVSSRLVLGLGVGLEGGTVPVYIAETVERKVRGKLVSLSMFNIAIGEVLGYAVAAMFLYVEGNWRLILGSAVLPSLLMSIGMLFLPESPRFLMHKGQIMEAFKVWKRIRGTQSYEAREELYNMKVSVQEEQRLRSESVINKRFPWLELFTVSRARRALIYANIIILLGQLTGVNAIMYYMSVLMSQIGFDDEKATYMSLIGGASLLIGTLPAVFFMEKFGRRFWANTMLPGFLFGLVLIGVSYQIPLETHLPAAEALYITGLVIYMCFFGSYACLTWVVPAEVYPTYLRSYGMTTSAALVYLAAFLVTYNFSAMQTAMTRTGLTLGFYGCIAVVGEIYQVLFMPETKNKSLEEIELIFRRPTRAIVAENWKNTKRALANYFAGS